MAVSDLDDPSATERGHVGGKAATLATLRGAGFNVPPGVVLPADLVAGWVHGDDAPPAVVASVEAALHRLGDVAVAVRSSAVREDAEEASFAGQYDTVLGVRGVEAAVDAVRRVIDSARAPVVRGYAGGDGGGRGIPSLAVLIQPMLAPDSAGVAFTADPVTGDRDVVRVAAVGGLADRMVAGEVEPEEWEVRSDGSVRLLQVPGGTAPVLDVATAGAVAAAARTIADHLGGPQDIEWALVDGEVQVLQSRPITVLPIPPSENLAGKGWQKDVAHYPEAVTPFGWSVFEATGRDATRAFLRDFGLLVSDLETRCIGGEVYARPVPVVGSAEPPPFQPPAWVLGVLARVVPAMRRRMRTADLVVREGRLDATLRRYWDQWRPDLVTRVDRLLDVDVAELDAEGLRWHFQECLDLARFGAHVHFQVFVPYVVAVHDLVATCRDLLGWGEAATMRLLAGCSPASTQGTRDLESIAADVRRDEAAVTALRRRPADPVRALRDVDADLADRLQGWVRRHGWRTINYDAGGVAWAERPGLVTPMLLNESTGEQPRDAADDAEREATTRLASAAAADRVRFVRALEAAREAYPVREDNVPLTDGIPCGLLRRWVVEVGHRLVADGVLARVDDVVFATAAEVLDALGGRGHDSLPEGIVRRRAEYAWVRAHPGPAFVGEAPPPPDVSRLPVAGRRLNEAILWAIAQEYPGPQPDGGPAQLNGLGASPGRYTGPVRVIRGEADFGRVRPGDVLVCQITTPAWTLLFGMAGAVVCDGGGALSHTSIVAREHALPAVVGTHTATATLRDGQLITVDGTTGEVRWA